MFLTNINFMQTANLCFFSKDQIMYDYIQYVGNRSVFLNKAIAVENYNYLNGMGYGLQAAEKIEKGSILFTVPKVACLNGKEFFSTHDGNKHIYYYPLKLVY